VIRLFHVYLPARTFALGVSEALLVALTFVVATIVRFGGDTELILGYEHGLAKIALVAVFFMLTLYYFDFYDSLVLNNRREILTRLVQVLGTTTVALAIVYYAFPEVRLGRGIFLLGILLLLFFLPTWRELFFWLARSLRLAHRAVIVGSGRLATALVEEVGARPEVGLQLVGYVDVASDSTSMNGLRYLGDLESLPALARRERLDRIIVALGDRRGKLPYEPLLLLKTHGVQVHEGIEVFERISGKIHLASLHLGWLLFSPGFGFSRLQRLFKRVVSFLGSLVGLALSLPLMGLIALAIKLDSPGPVIFQQERLGKDRKTFTVYKFRSMMVGADADGQPRPAIENDPRFTRVGRWLRRTRLDELPQLFNMLKGEMDFVGPRPFPPNLEEEFARQIPFYSQRWSVKPGVTGWAQVQRGYCATLEENAEKLSYDLFYIKNMSPGLDLFILFKTAKILLLGRGAR